MLKWFKVMHTSTSEYLIQLSTYMEWSVGKLNSTVSKPGFQLYVVKELTPLCD